MLEVRIEILDRLAELLDELGHTELLALLDQPNADAVSERARALADAATELGHAPDLSIELTARAALALVDEHAPGRYPDVEHVLAEIIRATTPISGGNQPSDG